jgi:hypothetical protein
MIPADSTTPRVLFCDAAGLPDIRGERRGESNGPRAPIKLVVIGEEKQSLVGSSCLEN